MSNVSVVVFDVNETLSDLSPLGRRFADVGAPEWAATVWFASLLRDGFALAAAGAMQPFADIARGTLRAVLTSSGAGAGAGANPDAAVDHVMVGFSGLPLHPDVADGVRALAATGVRLVTLSNGSAEVAEQLLGAAGIRRHFDLLLSVEDAGAWKPAAAAYRYALRTCAVDAGDVMLVAVHPWDIDGARRAGLRTCWVNREGSRYPDHFLPPDHSVTGVGEVVATLAGSAG